MIIASDKVIEERRNICKKCEHYTKMGVYLCNKCGCIVEGKIRLSSSECPVGKWSKEK